MANRLPAKIENAGMAKCSRQAVVAGLILAVLVLVAFFPSLKNNFVSYDDPDYVTSNVHVQQGLTLANVRWAFTTFAASNWHPLTWLSHMLDWNLFGANTWGHHLTSLLLHAASTVLFFLVFARMTQAIWLSLFIAALFGVHPLHVESVAWVSERKDVLSTIFWMLLLWCYVRFAEETKRRSQRGRLFYAGALACFCLGLLSKPMLVTVPFALLLLDYWPLNRLDGKNIRRLIVEKMPFFALAGIASLVTVLAQRSGGALSSTELLPFPARLANALVAYCRYLGKFFCPTKLAFFYPFQKWPSATVALAALFLVVVSVTAFLTRKKIPWLFVGWFWFLGTLVPVIGIVQVGAQAMADRYSYVPLIGIFIVLAWSAKIVITRTPELLRVISIAAVAALVFCVALTRWQVGYWFDSETLYRHALQVTRNNWLAHSSLGLALRRKGDLNDAIEQYQIAIRLNPTHAESHNNLGAALLMQERLPEAESELKRAIELDPKNASAHNNLGVLYYNLGRLDEAIAQFEESLRLRPDDAATQSRLATLLEEKRASPQTPSVPPPR